MRYKTIYRDISSVLCKDIIDSWRLLSSECQENNRQASYSILSEFSDEELMELARVAAVAVTSDISTFSESVSIMIRNDGFE